MPKYVVIRTEKARINNRHFDLVEGNEIDSKDLHSDKKIAEDHARHLIESGLIEPKETA